eukprot:g30482.t1
MAKTKTTTIVIWDRHHKQRDESKVASSVKKKTFTEVFAEQGPDKAVMQKAEEFFSVGAPKCALVLPAEEQLKTEAELERPLSKVNDLMDSCRHNHLETIANFNVFKIYKPWIHANRACTFVLIPPKLCWEWDDDLATCTVGSRRIVRSDPVRLPDGSGWTVGLQMTHSSASVNAVLASATVMSVVLGDDAAKHSLAGRCLELSMTCSQQFKKQVIPVPSFAGQDSTAGVMRGWCALALLFICTNADEGQCVHALLPPGFNLSGRLLLPQAMVPICTTTTTTCSTTSTSSSSRRSFEDMEDATGKLKGTLFWGPNSVDGEIDETLLDGYDIWLVDACGEQYGHLGQVLKLDIRSKCCNTEAYNFTFDVIDMPKEPWTVRGREGLSTGRCGPSLHGCVRGTHEFHDHALQG